MNVLDLFSGIGGFSLGLERAGMKTVAFCEIEKFPQKVLKKHWPEVPIYDDIRKLTAERLRTDGIPSIDVVCGGFPCQPFSQAGKRKGTEDGRDLWPEMFRVIQEVRPRWVIGENVAGFISMGLERTIADLESEAYEVQPFIIPACAVGAPHRRDRIWIVAHAISQRQQGQGESIDSSDQKEGRERETDNAFNERVGNHWTVEPEFRRTLDGISKKLDGGLNVDKRWTQTPCTKTQEIMLSGLRECREALRPPQERGLGRQFTLKYSNALQFLSHLIASQTGRPEPEERETALCGLRETIIQAGVMLHAFNEEEKAWQSLSEEEKDWAILAVGGGVWLSEWPDTPRVAMGIPNRVDRLKGLGNAVVPQVVEAIGRVIIYQHTNTGGNHG